MNVLNKDREPVAELVVGQVVLVPDFFGSYAFAPITKVDGDYATADGVYNLYNLKRDDKDWYCFSVINKAAIERIQFLHA